MENLTLNEVCYEIAGTIETAIGDILEEEAQKDYGVELYSATDLANKLADLLIGYVDTEREGFVRIFADNGAKLD
jgi:hypothetical protein